LLARAAGAAFAALAVAALPTPAAPADVPRSVLVSYSFDEDVSTGPDTFAVYRGAKGGVTLSPAFHISGHRSVELRDAAGDGNFPELQGYFPVRTTGRLFFHFAFLTTDTKEELNIALAGPRFFQIEKDGIGFWLGTRDGMLVHTSDSIPKKLFAPDAFVWYTVDVSYDVESGTYALTIRREGEGKPLVALRNQPNAARQPGSAIDKFSFVGSPYGDRSNVVYYVDDVVIGTDASVTAAPFVAPGRRKLFVDYFTEYEKLLREKPRCLPAGGPADFGLTSADLDSLGREGLLGTVEHLLAGTPVDRAALAGHGPGHWRDVLGAAADWKAGCALLEAGEPAKALPRFERAAAAIPEGRLFAVSAVIALAGLKRFEEADLALAELSDWRDDPRYAVASAYVGIARGDLDRADAWLRDPAARALDRDVNPLLGLFGSRGMSPDVIEKLKAQMGDRFAARLEETLVAEQYYYVQLWKGRHDVARDYALRMTERLARAGIPGGLWVQRAGDASFYGGDLVEARELFTRAIAGEKDNGVLMAVYLKLADLAFLSGDFETERYLREHYYGALTE
jgi:tetratricopeptide (TPR) repeat protein